MMKKIEVFVLLAVMLFSFGLCRAEETGSKDDDFQYVLLEDGTAEIVKYVGDDMGVLIIPDTLYGIKVTGIGDYAFEDFEFLESVTIPDSITRVGANPFGISNYLAEIIVSPDHPYLEVIDGVLVSKPDQRLICYPRTFTAKSYAIPDGIRVIGVDAFRNCTSLTSVTIPDSVTEIGDNAFHYCESLASVIIPDSVTRIGNGAFSQCAKLSSVTIPDGVKEIGDYTFWDSSSLASVTIPDGVTGIGAWAFSGCDSLTAFTIPDGVTSIGKRAFHGCSALASVTIPDSVKSIGEGAFQFCESLTSVTIPDGVTSIENAVFYDCTSLSSAVIPDSVTNIAGRAFYGCSSLTSVTIPAGVDFFDSNPFVNCDKLTDIIVSPDHPYLEIIDGVLFSKVSGELICYPCALKAKSYEIPAGTLSIGLYSFSGCTSLTSVTIPDSVYSIGSYAFENCTSLKSVKVPASVTYIEKNVFAIEKNGEYVPNPSLTVTVPRGSCAAQYCEENGVKYTFSK